MVSYFRLFLIVFILVIFSVFIYFSNEDNISLNKRLKPNISSIVVNSGRMFVHTKGQLELTKTVTIDQNNCNSGQRMAIFIHSSAQISGKYFEKRQTLRKTWVKTAKNLNISVYFAFGLNGNLSVDQRLKEEAEEYKDIIQFAFIDNYYNITLKAISILRWIDRKCSDVKYVLKCDDDVMVNIELLIANLGSFSTGFNGELFQLARPHRWPTSKWYFPYNYYPDEFYPNYLNGPAYMMAGPIIKPLISGLDNYSGYVYDIDDMFITGIIAEKVGIGRYDSSLLGYDCSNPCLLHSNAIIISCKSSNSSIHLWNEWQNTSRKICQNIEIQKRLINVIIVFIIVSTFVAFIHFLIFYKIYSINSIVKITKVHGFKMPLIFTERLINVKCKDYKELNDPDNK